MRTDGPPSSPVETEQGDSVVLEDHSLDLLIDTQGPEVLYPTIRSDQWEVRTEQDLVLQRTFHVLDELRWEPLRSPS